VDHNLLRQFVAAAELLHFARAAKELGMPRPALMASIRSLEADLGVELFDRSASTTVLTEAGKAFLVDARRQLDKSAAAAAASAAGPGGKAKASKGKGRAPAVKGVKRPGRPRQSR
jgi:DNA-binding transcriptional LysR family regulator